MGGGGPTAHAYFRLVGDSCLWEAEARLRMRTSALAHSAAAAVGEGQGPVAGLKALPGGPRGGGSRVRVRGVETCHVSRM